MSAVSDLRTLTHYYAAELGAGAVHYLESPGGPATAEARLLLTRTALAERVPGFRQGQDVVGWLEAGRTLCQAEIGHAVNARTITQAHGVELTRRVEELFTPCGLLGHLVSLWRANLRAERERAERRQLV